ncbi:MULTISPECIES: DUF4429 domain-containing protein [unclassified Streptomyces]|uniref:DUF4429 domain-containing protein n=1 Tax=unclassified Streptomyces TaxID=2593676 RepID=UPI00225178F5|nr:MULTISPECIES: DUF4429 domain-containing protein [unclassified Streptomyces]MCX4525704.1 DUF4429 domain-containing protein [Streptomyces sp. NBC_01551]MCX4543726.1 DUF4429 domain-containing protein [Streptomyces sp. NBC_01565]
MGDVLAGNHAVWEFDSDSVLIRFARGMRTPRLWHALGPRRIPLEALSEVTVNPGKRDTVILRAVPRPGADPLMEAAAGQLREACDPYRLVLPGDRNPQATAFAEAVRGQLGPEAAEPAPRFLVDVPEPQRHLKASDARVGFDGSAVTFHWSRTGATSTKWRAGDQRYPLGELAGVEWHSPEGPGDGHLRLLPLVPRSGGGHDPRPAYDLAAAVLGIGHGAVHESLPFTAAVLAALPRERRPASARGLLPAPPPPH